MRVFSVAVFLAVVAGLLYYLLSTFTQMKEGGETYELVAFFENTGGINRGNPVKMVGKTIGSVGEITFDYDRRGVSMVLEISGQIQIPDDSELKIAEKGMLGEMFLYFTFGSSKTLLSPGSEVSGLPPVVMSDVMSSAGDAMDSVGGEMTELLQGLNGILAAPGLKDHIVDSISELPVLVKELSGMIRESKPLLLRSLGNVVIATENLSRVTSTLDEQLQVLSEKKSLEKLDDGLQNFSKLMSSVDGMVASELTPGIQDVRSVLGETKNSLTELQTVMKQIQPALGGLVPNAESTASKLLHDDTLHLRMEDFLMAGTDLLKMLEEQPNSVIFGNRRKDKPKSSRRQDDEDVIQPTLLKVKRQ
jgi:phospholipid/cholesterol/gamma-HCH transport system substrate-binding protein